MYVCYIDFRKAFDSVWPKGLWRVMRHYGYPEKIVRILQNMYNETFSAVRVDGDLSDWFNTSVGLLQGGVLSHLLFNIFLEVIVAIALSDVDIGAVLSGVLLSDLRFADDIALLSEDACGLQSSVNQVVLAATGMGMCISKTKTEVQYRGKGNKEFQILVDGQQTQQSDNFIYLGGNVSTEGGADGDITKRLGLASLASGVLQSLCDIRTTRFIQSHKDLCL